MGAGLRERFGVTPQIVKQCLVQTSSAAAAADVTGSSINIPEKPPSGLGYRITLAGTNTGGNTATTLILYLGATAAMTLTQDDVTAVDWVAQFVIIWADAKNQRILGRMDANSLDCECDYAAGTVDCTAGVTMKCSLNSGASDSATCDMVLIEKWQMPLATS